MGTKQYDSATDLITFSRASSATFLGSNGLLQTAANNVPRIEYDATGAVKGLLIEEARTNLLLNSGTLATQSVTVSATGNTLSFTGTGTVTLSGVSTAGPLVGTGTGENNRVNLTFTPTAGTLTLTVSGTVTNAQLEAGAFPTSYIPTTGATATRARDLAEIPTSAFGYNNDKGSLVIDVLAPVADQLMTLAHFNTSSYLESRSLWKTNSNFTAAGNHFLFVCQQTTIQLGAYTQDEYIKLGLSYGDSERAVKDGGTVASGTKRYVNPTRLHLGGRDSGYQSQCWIKSIQYYPRQLTDTQLQELTT